MQGCRSLAKGRQPCRLRPFHARLTPIKLAQALDGHLSEFAVADTLGRCLCALQSGGWEVPRKN